MALLAACGPTAIVLAETAVTPTPADLATVQQQLDTSAARQADLKAKAKALKGDIDALSDELVSLASTIQAREQMVTAAEARLTKLNETESMLAVELVSRREALADLLAGLQQLDRNPPPPIVTGRDDAVGAVRGAMLFAAILPEVRARSMQVTESMARLDEVRGKLAKERQGLDQDLQQLADNRAKIDALIAKKRALSDATGDALAKERANAKALAEKARSLKDLLAALDEQRQADAAKAAEEAKQAEAAQAAATAKAEAERRMAALPPVPPDFGEARGKLDYPAQGQKVREFGDDDGFGGKSKGLFIETRQKAQVIAPAGGRVEYAGEFRSYGQLLILDVGGGYHVLLAGLGTLSAQTGQIVRPGEPLGTMGDEPARSTLIGDLVEDHSPILYVEFRKNGGAIDPSPWWIGARREARG
ncbi:MAG: peptidoglycan DD-metalloendopeptidase family protein [Hyphomicrobiales bacterium]